MELEFITEDGKITVHASDYKSAFKKYPTDIEYCKLLINVKSSYSALLFAAVHIAKKAADKACSTATQAMIYNECNKIYHSVINSIVASDNDDESTAAALSELIYSADNDPDAKEYISIAQDALTESIVKNMAVSDCILSGYRAVNCHINKLRTASEKERTQEYITAQGGDIIAITDLFARIISKSKKEYIPSQPPTAAAGKAAEKRAAELGTLIKHIAETVLSPVQREILYYVVVGMTVAQIASKRKCTEKNIYNHITNIRYKYACYLQDNNTEIIKLHNIDVAGCEADYIKRNDNKNKYKLKKRIK